MMATGLTHMTDYLLAQSWQIALLVVVVAAVNLALRDKSAHIRYLLWLIVLAKCLVPPLFTVPLAILPQEKIEPASMAPMVEVVPPDPTVPDTTMAESTSLPSVSFEMPPLPKVQEEQQRFTIREWLAIGWIVGASVFLAFNLLRALRANLWLWRRRKLIPAELRSNIEKVFSTHNIKRFPEIWLIEGFNQPFVWGLVHGSIYLPVNFLNINRPDHQRNVLGHELSHILRFDAAVNILQVIAQAIFWFHPFVWWANRRIRAEREKCCDEMAVARLNTSPRDYSTAILEILSAKHESARPVPSLAVAGPVKNIEERIKTMLRPGKKFHKGPSLVTATFTLLLGLLTVPTSLVLTALAQTEPPPQRKAEITQSIYFAASEGSIEQVRLHISNGSDVNKKDTIGETALHYAVRYGLEDVAKLLIANGAHVNEKNADGNTPLHYAARYGHKTMAELLISAGADVSAKNKNGDLPIQLGANEGVLDLLIAKGPILSSIQMAAYQGDIAKVKRFLEQGISVDSRDSGGRTALHYAALHGKRAVVEFLLNQGADVNAKDKGWGSIRWGFTPLKHASSGGHKDVVELLIAKGANVDAMDKYGWTALDSAVYGRKDIAEMLIKAGANVNSRYWWGETPLIWAAHDGQADIADLLIANGAEIDARDYYGRTALYHAAWRGFRDVAELLISKGANVNVRSEQGRSPLWIAENTGPKQIAEMLRMHRDDGWEKATSADVHKEIAELLRQHGAKE